MYGHEGLDKEPIVKLCAFTIRLRWNRNVRLGLALVCRVPLFLPPDVPLPHRGKRLRGPSKLDYAAKYKALGMYHIVRV